MMRVVQPFSFAIHRSDAASADDWLAFARRAEDLGYEAVYIPDHLNHQLSPIAALAAAAAVTSRIRFAAYVFANDYRHPLILAREIATLDVLSNGRVDLGLGAGWMTSDYRQLGIPYDAPKVRVDRLFESVGLVQRLLAGETVTHEGPHYRLDRARIAPTPVQRPIPLMIGGGGPRMLRFAAQHADIVGLIPGMDRHGRPHIPQATDAATAEKARFVREAAGDRWDRIRLDVIVFDAGLVGSGSGVLPSLATAAKGAVVNLIGTPYVLYGTLAEVRERLLRRRDATGISHYTLPGHAIESMAPLVEALAGR